ncbi:MAG: hypothetical protein E6J90_24765 [Deltaproteobacteria bacterium]|nr:MAG: hypothetical protein E6J90_24765 [Deltaproteobacteria bacterium]
MSLRIPAALAFTVVGAAAVGAAVAAGSCDAGQPRHDATTCQVLCIPQGGGSSSACPLPTCATGSNHDMCPPGCVPEPIV